MFVLRGGFVLVFSGFFCLSFFVVVYLFRYFGVWGGWEVGGCCGFCLFLLGIFVGLVFFGLGWFFVVFL